MKKAEKTKEQKERDKELAERKANRRELPLQMIAHCSFEKDATAGFMHMTTDSAEVSQGGKKIGSVSNIVGGGVEVIIDGYTYAVGPEELFRSFKAAHDYWLEQRKKEAARAEARKETST